MRVLTPRWVSSLGVWRVSSQAIRSASASALASRGGASSRLPIGVPQTTSLPSEVMPSRLKRVERPCRGRPAPPFSGVLGPRQKGKGVGSPFVGAGCTATEMTARAFPSRGVAYPAACLAVRGLGCRDTDGLGPGGEIGGGVAVPVSEQTAAPAAEGPFGQPHALPEQPAARADLGRREPAVGDHHLPAKPDLLVADLPGEFRPAGVGDGAGETLISGEVGSRKVFQAQ